MKGKTPITGLIVLCSVLLVAAGLFGALFFLDRPDPRTDACLAAAHLLADTADRAPAEGTTEGPVTGFERLCSTASSS